MKISFCTILLSSFIIISCNNAEEKTPEKKTEKSPIALLAPKENAYVPVDVSPMDMAYYPVDYSKLKMADSISTPPVMRIIYSRPHKAGRVIFGKLQQYGEPWRLGANEASEIDFYQTVKIQNTTIAPGRYIIYCIPYPDRWEIILNSDIDVWGLHIDPKKDLYKFQIPIKEAVAETEFFTMLFEKTSTGADLVMAWDTTEARLPIKF